MSDVIELPGIRQADEGLHAELMEIIARLRDMRSVKSGKKTYDYVVAGYFEDMLQVLIGARKSLEARRTLRASAGRFGAIRRPRSD